MRSKVAYVAGHSLGEYSALAAAGSLGLADAARLLRLRGRAMQSAVPVGAGAMAALIGLDFEAASAIAAAAAEGGVCAAANDNAPGQVVVSGDRAAVERAVELARAGGAKRAILLPVSAPFHCALMAPAAAAMEEALATVELAAPAVPLVANVVAGPVTDPAEIRRNLVRQVTGMVRWRESIGWLGQAGVDGLRRDRRGHAFCPALPNESSKAAETLAVGTPDEVDAAGRPARLNRMRH